MLIGSNQNSFGWKILAGYCLKYSFLLTGKITGSMGCGIGTSDRYLVIVRESLHENGTGTEKCRNYRDEKYVVGRKKNSSVLWIQLYLRVEIPILGLPTFCNSLVFHTKASLNQDFCHLEWKRLPTKNLQKHHHQA